MCSAVRTWNWHAQEAQDDQNEIPAIGYASFQQHAAHAARECGIHLLTGFRIYDGHASA